jgi:hypothetical protein
MITQEQMNTASAERQNEAARLFRQKQARAAMRRRAAPRSGQSSELDWPEPIHRMVLRVIRGEPGRKP